MRTPGKAIVAVLLWIAIAVPAASAGRVVPAAQGESVITMRLDGELSVDAGGAVHDYTIRTEVTPGVQQFLDRVIPRWKFEPVLMDGKPVIARSPMRIVLAAEPADGNYTIRLDNVLFIPNSAEEHETDKKLRDARDGYGVESMRMRPPRYPPELLYAGVGGIVLLNVRVAPDGRVEEAFAVQSSLLDVKGRAWHLEPARVLLERNAVAAARQWRFRIDAPDPQALTPAQRTVRVPVEYAIDRPGNRELTGSWRHEYRGPNITAPWLQDAQDGMVVGVSDLASGEMLSGSPSLHLLNRNQALGAAAP